MKRSRVFGGLAFAAMAAIFVLSAQRAVLRRHPTLPQIEGARIQNGWIMDGSFDGTLPQSPPKTPSQFATWLSQVLPFAAKQEEEGSCLDYTPSFIGLRLRVPASASDFSVIGLTAKGASLSFLNSTTRPWHNKEYQYETFLPLPALRENDPWIDVVVQERQKQVAKWRVANLPRLVHHDFAPTQGGTMALAPQCTVAGRAWWNPNEPKSWVWAGDFPGTAYDGRKPLRVDLHIDRSTNMHFWKLLNPKLTQEWDVAAKGDARSFMVGAPSQTYANDSVRSARLIGFAAIDPRVQNVVQVTGTAEEHIRIADSVTFRDVPVRLRGDTFSVIPGAAEFVKRSANGAMVSLKPVGGFGIFGSRADSAPDGSLLLCFRVSGHVARRAEKSSASNMGDDARDPVVVIDPRVVVLGSTEDAETENDNSADSSIEYSDYFSTVTLINNQKPLDHADIRITFQEEISVKEHPFHITLPVHPGKPEAGDGEP